MYGGLAVPRTSSRSWQRPCRVNAMPSTGGGLIRRTQRPSMSPQYLQAPVPIQARRVPRLVPVQFPTVLPPSESTGRVSEAELIARARAGDPDAFGELVELHQVAVYRAARAALRTEDEAEDVAQEAFVAAFRKLGEFRGESSFKTWLLAITWNFARSRRRTGRQWLQRFAPRGEGAAADPPARDESHEEGLIRADLAARVRRVVMALPPKFREVLLLAASGDHTLEQIGSILGIPTGTVKWRMSEGRRQLKARLTRLGIGHE